MADIKAARKEIQKVVAFLVPRMPADADVFKHLTAALAHLKTKEVKEPPVVAAPSPPYLVKKRGRRSK
jgi:hypothetical protein